MHPVLFEFGPIQIRFYGLMYVVAILVASRIIKGEVRRKGIPLTEDEVMNFILWVTIAGIAGARAYYVVFNWRYYSAFPSEIPAVWHGGLAIHGGVIGGLLAAWLYLRKKDAPFWRLSDCVAPALILGQAFGRFGNFMNGDAHGVPTDLPWGMVFPPGSIAGTEFPGVPIHPVMLYEMMINLGIFAILWLRLRKKNHKDGFIFATYMLMYSGGRFVVESFRADSLMLGSLRAAQVLSLVLITAAGAVMIKKRLHQAPEGL
ncbi:MAG: prolipoprotein diacylglyceryl transferase [Deltaproteobacteria bacterium]|nr:prolipoprotein diacylglyceryl transferase [Deltaproteobacteria bacterium]